MDKLTRELDLYIKQNFRPENFLNSSKKKSRKSSEVYTKAGLTKSHFSKLKADKNYHP